ncbi:MAG: DUF4442 domain-containing protein [Myxococcales bacterium]|nr:DUF4442 domain-containing protein [Myxococcales bacterium]
MIPQLDQTLRTVPLFSSMGIRTEEVGEGRIVLRLPVGESVANHAGAIHSSAIFTVGELAASVVLGMHPALSELVHLQKSTKIKYYLLSQQDVTAHATLSDEQVAAIREAAASGMATTDVVVKVLDGHGRDVAELVSRFGFRQP